MTRLYEGSDYVAMKGWYEKRGHPVPHGTFLPPVGYIEPGVAAGFLVACDNYMGIFDFYISNPDAAKELRIKAFEDITKRLIEYADYLNIKVLKADTQVSTIKDLCRKFSFKYVGEYSTFTKEI